MTVYAVEYSNGVVKIGHTSNIASRMGNHRAYARKRGLEITSTHTWELEPSNCAEMYLKMFARHFGGERFEGTREYFTGMDLPAFITAVDNLRMEPWEVHFGQPYAIAVKSTLPKRLQRHAA